MIKRTYTDNRGFTLLEIVIVLAILSTLTAVIMPRLVTRIWVKAAEKTALEMKLIQDGAKAYYVDNHAWPANIAALKTGGYINSNWTTNNPWGNAYNIATAGSTLQVSTDLSSDYHGTIIANLPSVTTSGDTVTSTIPIPGTESSSSTIPSGAILIFNGAACPSGYTRVSSLDNYFIMGGTSFGTTGGSSTHTHTYFMGIAAQGCDPSSSSGDARAVRGHNHPLTIDSTNHLPPWTTVLFCQKD